MRFEKDATGDHSVRCSVPGTWHSFLMLCICAKGDTAAPSMPEDKGAPVAEDDAYCVSVLRSLNILDTAPEECFDHIAASAIECLKVLLKCLPHACAVSMLIPGPVSFTLLL